MDDITKQPPAPLVKLALSPELYKSSEKIGEQFSLHIDQIGELDALIRKILLGKSKSSDFISTIMEKLEIDRQMADDITKEVNKEVFENLKSKMQTSAEAASADETVAAAAPSMPFTQMTPSAEISAIEKAGNFEIDGKSREDNMTDSISAYTKPRSINVLETVANVRPTTENADAAEKRAGIEVQEESKQEFMETGDPAMNTAQVMPRHSVPPPENLPGEEEITDPIVEHLMENPVATVHDSKVINVLETAPKTAPKTGTKPTDGTDPYREPTV